MRRFLLLLLLLFLHVESPAIAQGFDEAAKGFAADSFAKTVTAIEGVSASGDPRAAPLIAALKESRLFFTPAGGLFYQDAAGKTFDALTGSEAALPADAAPVRLNNRVRNVLAKAGGASDLQSPDAAKRLDAAAALLKSRDKAALPGLEAAITAEQQPRVKSALELARSAIILADDAAPEAARLAAAEALAASGESDALNLLRDIRQRATGALKITVDAAISGIETRRQMRELAQTIWFGISLGSVLLLAAIGLAITFGVMGVINMAHGEMVMIGAYVTFLVQEVMRAYAPACSIGRSPSLCRSLFSLRRWSAS